MREKWARRIVLLTGFLALLLAAVFALTQNPTKAPDTTGSKLQEPPAELIDADILDANRIEVGRQLYRKQNCASCHSIAGEGNPRNSLDGVGSRRTADELRNWITGADILQGTLPGGVLKMKREYRALSVDDIDALVVYMQSLRR